jgi:hypothetical protein
VSDHGPCSAAEVDRRRRLEGGISDLEVAQFARGQRHERAGEQAGGPVASGVGHSDVTRDRYVDKASVAPDLTWLLEKFRPAI